MDLLQHESQRPLSRQPQGHQQMAQEAANCCFRIRKIRPTQHRLTDMLRKAAQPPNSLGERKLCRLQTCVLEPAQPESSRAGQ